MNAARHGRTASWAPTKRRVVAGAGAASLAMFMVAGVGIARAHSTVNLEVDGVVYPVSTWSHTVSGVLSQADIELGEHDQVQPAASQYVANGQTIVVRTAKPYTLTINGDRTTLWSTAPSA